MKIRDVEIITTQDLIEQRTRKHYQSFFSHYYRPDKEDILNWKPEKYSKQELYFDSFKEYKIYCNFSKGDGVVLLNRKAETILDLCNSARTIKDLFTKLSLKGDWTLKINELFHLGKAGIPFGQIYKKLRFGEEILTQDNLIEILFLFVKLGLINNPAQLSNFREEKFLQSGKVLNVYFYLTTILYQESVTEKEMFQTIDSIFDFSQKNNYEKISIKIFSEKSSEPALLKELFIYGKKKSIEYFIDIDFFLFVNWTIITSRAIKEFRKVGASLIFPLEGIGKIYDQHSKFLKREGNFKDVERALNILRKERCPFLVIATITSLGLDSLEGLARYLFDKKLNFIFGFIPRHNLVPKSLLPDPEKLIRKMLEVYNIIERKMPPNFLFSSVLGRHFQFGKYKIEPIELWTVYKKNEMVIQKMILEIRKKNDCASCQFEKLCLGSQSVITDYFSLREDKLDDYCEVYKQLIPEVLKLEAKRILEYKK